MYLHLRSSTVEQYGTVPTVPAIPLRGKTGTVHEPVLVQLKIRPKSEQIILLTTTHGEERP